MAAGGHQTYDHAYGDCGIDVIPASDCEFRYPAGVGEGANAAGAGVDGQVD